MSEQPPLDPTLVIPPGSDTDLTECLFEAGDEVPAGDMMTDAFTGERVPLREPWTCSETGWYVYANGTYTKVAVDDD
jgi:hypothetical protein